MADFLWMTEKHRQSPRARVHSQKHGMSGATTYYDAIAVRDGYSIHERWWLSSNSILVDLRSPPLQAPSSNKHDPTILGVLDSPDSDAGYTRVYTYFLCKAISDQFLSGSLFARSVSAIERIGYFYQPFLGSNVDSRLEPDNVTRLAMQQNTAILVVEDNLEISTSLWGLWSLLSGRQIKPPNTLGGKNVDPKGKCPLSSSRARTQISDAMGGTRTIELTFRSYVQDPVEAS
ncbi:hypothetical protein NEOLEDRAFT_1144933 [Neolentinus lepideus HHB14362 ss-1]|uniref:Uncharacterized protein n=1 Tax=Neolentinus lepideus HHB14362 ss-1 TaxID=1314782 RepID=A0A165VLU5_9AGAM|nr:hypothetical protein NEOLEDRAFT_1144933 [Neolentinus lepideus HHB14362 ss-1]